MRRLHAVTFFGAMLLATGVGAQDAQWWDDPLYGAVELSGGFTPDPSTVDVDAGGSMEVDSRLAPDCAGYIAPDRPDVKLAFEPGTMPLFIYVTSSADTTLVIRGPDDRWYCNDDFMGTDPMVVFQNPHEGEYLIWVGTWDEDAFGVSATLNFSELNPTR